MIDRLLVDGRALRVGRDWFGFGYDESALRERRAVVLDATLRLAPADSEALRAAVTRSTTSMAWPGTVQPSIGRARRAARR
jgi:UDP-N-acetylenolpyruvoylglucosamine reductase